MIRSSYPWRFMFLLIFCMASCQSMDKQMGSHFDDLNRTVEIGNWQYSLSVENQNTQKQELANSTEYYYIKATLHMTNIKTKMSLLYSASKNNDEYAAMYKYLSFDSKDDLYIKNNDELIYPIGYVFEPSNGLSKSEKLVYKFQIDKAQFGKLRNSKNVEFWYIDKLIGLGKICFKQQ